MTRLNNNSEIIHGSRKNPKNKWLIKCKGGTSYIFVGVINLPLRFAGKQATIKVEFVKQKRIKNTEVINNGNRKN